METSLKVQIKGIREGLLITLEEGPWPAQYAALLEHIGQQVEFLRGGRLILDVGNQVLRPTELSRLRDTLSERGLTLWAVLSGSPVTERTAQDLGLATRLPRPKPDNQPRSPETALSGEQAVLVRRTLRSGVSLQHHGHVVVIGDVNPGGEIIAGGDVVVWGRLRGVVHAGAEGDEGAVVCALDLSPTQLRIAGQIALTPKRRGRPLPEMARLKDGQVVAEPWIPPRRES
ncbi:MAG TPA: septum site-determining protein MinC [Anaerolineales bacterium]|nr:septum site-determining protein MinC [Anaerolineales bacterium]